tara:strand:+ start:59 stop:1876 length:1818 start_codon:yes stop_codon:yes gene_type:complete
MTTFQNQSQNVNVLVDKNIYQKIYLIFNFIGKKDLIKLLFLIIIGASLEVAGVGAVGPFIGVLIDPDLINSNKILNQLLEYTPDVVNENFNISFGLFVILLFLLLNTYLAYLFFSIEKVARKNTANISVALLKKYLSKEYNFFLNRNSKDLVTNIIVESSQVIHGVVLSILLAFGKLIIFLFLCALLLSINLKFTLFLIIFFGTIFLLIFSYSKNKLKILGYKRSLVDKLKYLYANEAIDSIKESKVLNSENFFLKKFKLVAYEYATIHTNVVKYIIFPKYFIEFLVLSSAITILVVTTSLSSFTSQLPIISIFIFAGYRMLPSLQVIYNAFSSVKKAEESLNIIFKDLLSDRKNKDINFIYKKKEISFNKNLEFKNVSFKYDSSKDNLINNVNFTINKNEKIAIIGKTGLGKSTLVDLIIGLIYPQKGSVNIDNNQLNINNVRSWFEKISYIPQKIFFLGDSVYENISLGKVKDIDQKKIKEILDFSELSNKSINIENVFSKKIEDNGKNLSGGEKQRIGIARALFQNRDIMILDEATSALDKDTEEKIINNLLKLNKTIISISHNTTHIEKFDKILFFKSNGEINFDIYDSLKNSKEFKELTY